jgi:hypothetical protein
MIHIIAQEVGIPTSSVVVRFAPASGQRRLQDDAVRFWPSAGQRRMQQDDMVVTAMLLTEAVGAPQDEAESLRSGLIEFIKSGEMYKALVGVGVFPELIGVEVSTCCELSPAHPSFCCDIEAYDASLWEGEVIPSLKRPEKNQKITKEDEAFEDEQEAKEYLPDSFVISVNVVIGISGVDKRRKSILFPNGEPIYRGTDFTTNDAQVHLKKLCDFESESLEEALGKEVVRELHVREVKCFISDFSKWLEEEDLGAYPIGQEFEGLLRSWVLTPEGRRWKGFFGIVDNELTWVRMEVVTNVPKKSNSAEILLLMDHFDKVLEYRNADLPKPDLEAWSCSRSFVIAETEDGIISGTFWCALTSLTCALLSIFLFTASAVLAVTVVLTVAMVVACQAGTMFVILGWDFGAVEAVSLILFVGFSVDYTLHLAEAFHLSPPPKVQNALSRVAQAIVSAGITTGGSAVFLFFCIIQVFKNFGLAVVLNTIWSLLFALVFYPAILDSLPRRYHESAYLPTFGEEDEDEANENFGEGIDDEARVSDGPGHTEGTKVQLEEEMSQSTAKTLPSTTVSSTTRPSSMAEFGMTKLGRPVEDQRPEKAGVGLLEPARSLEASGPADSMPGGPHAAQVAAAGAARQRFEAARIQSEGEVVAVRPATPLRTEVSIHSAEEDEDDTTGKP